MAFLRDKERLNSTTEPAEFEGEWEVGEGAKDTGDKGTYAMTYDATEAGQWKLHVWCDPTGKGERVAFPGSPFSLYVAPGNASTDVSHAGNGAGWTKVFKEEKNAKFSKGQQQSDPHTLVAGDTITIRPEIFDQVGTASISPYLTDLNTSPHTSLTPPCSLTRWHPCARLACTSLVMRRS